MVCEWEHAMQRILTNPMGIIGKYPNREVLSPGFLSARMKIFGVNDILLRALNSEGLYK